MAARPPLPRTGQMPARVLIAGGGVAALEAMLALRSFAEERVAITMLSACEDFVYRPLEIAAVFGAHPVRRFDLRRIAGDQGAELAIGTMTAVDAHRRVALTADGREIPYDALLVAVGARARPGVPGAITFGAPGFRRELRRLLVALECGELRRVVFTAPGGAGWILPLYELALMTDDHLRSRGAQAEIAIATAEEAPLEVFGRAAGETVATLLAERGIELLCEHWPVRAEEGALVTVPSGRVDADRVIALPALSGPGIDGLPAIPGGFIPVDSYAQVDRMDGVYAAGDATAFPVKQGGLAAQQATAAASHIAWRAGAPTEPAAFRPVLRGLLLTGRAGEFLRADLSGRSGDESEASDHALWWPPAKIAGRHLAPYLAARPSLELAPVEH